MIEKNHTPFSSRSSKIGKIFLIRVIMFSSVLTFIFTGGQLYFEYKHDINILKETEKQIDSSHIKSIETAVWGVNEQQAMALLEGIVALPTVTKATIINKGGVIYQFEDKNIIGDFTFTRDLHPPSDINKIHSSRVIGELLIQQTSIEAQQNLRNRLAVVLLSNFIKTFLVAAFILYLFHSLVSRHLMKINNFLNHVKLNKVNQVLVLDRTKNIKDTDEFDRFVDSFNSMSYELHGAWIKLENSEKRYRLLIEGSLQGILILDEYWRFLYANKQCFKIFGLHNHQDDINNVIDSFPRKTIEKVDNFFITKNQTSLYIDEICLQLHDKRKRFVQATLVKTTHEGLPALQIVMYDISHTKKMKEKQKDYEMQLIHNNKMASIGTMVSGVTHEINNPNHMIKQNALILTETWKNITPIIESFIKINPDQVSNNLPLSELKTIIPTLIEDIQHGSERISQIIEDLKSFVRQDQNQEVKQCNINEVLKDAIHLLRISIQQRCNNFTLELDDNLPDVWGYPQRLAQVFINLIVNALESLESADKKIIIKTFSRGENVSILFKDEGIGVPHKEAKKIFDVFFSTKLDTGGTGLGLSISQSIIAQHNGVIRLNDSLDAGSEFLIQLPINKHPMKISLGLN